MAIERTSFEISGNEEDVLLTLEAIQDINETILEQAKKATEAFNKLCKENLKELEIVTDDDEDLRVILNAHL